MSLYFGNRQVALNLGDAIRDTILPEPTVANAGRIVKVGEEGGYILSTDALPSQTGNSGKFLTTNGTTASWTVISTPDMSAYMQKDTDYVTAGKQSGVTLGSKATSEGQDTAARGARSHAEGYYTAARGNSSHAEGSGSVASGDYSHAEGWQTEASGIGSHAEGLDTTASGDYSHAAGDYTLAQRKAQYVFGEYNISDTTGTTTTRGQYVEIVGNGNSNVNRSNARTLDWSGNEVLAGKLTVGTGPTNNMDVATKQYVDTTVANVDTLPSQTGNSGKFLTTDGTAASWANVTIPTYTLSMSENRITLTPSLGTASYIDLPVYNGAAVV